MPLREKLVGLVVVERNLRPVDLAPVQFLYGLAALSNDRERGQAEEVHLEHARLLKVGHLELRGELLLVIDRDGDEFFERLRADDDARGVNRRVARAAFEPLGDVYDLADLRVRLERLFEFRHRFERLVNRDVAPAYRRRDELGNLLNVGVRHVERAAHVLNGGLRGHRAEGDDLADGVASVELRDVVDYFGPPVDAEVNVNVGHRDALGVEEALEQKIILERVHVRDFDTVGYQASCRRSSSGADGDWAVFGELDEVPDDEEVRGEAHALDH